jgi:lipopolysaccharide heptosyltransferase II
MTFRPEWQGAQNILCVRLDALGDVLMTSPALRALKETQLQRNLVLLASGAGAEASALIPELDQTVVYDPPWMKASAPVGDAAHEFEMVQQLKRMSLDAAIIFTTFSQSPLPAAMLSFLAEIPLRLAYCRENPYQLLTDWLPETDQAGGFELRHEVRRQLDLVASIGSTTNDERISLHVPSDALERTRDMLRSAGIDTQRPWLIIQPGGSAPSRRYPVESYAEAARQLVERHHYQVLFTGTGLEVDLIEETRRRMQARSFSLAGRLSLAELAAAIALAPLLVSNNTGPVHIAAGVRTPVVDLYALTNPQHTPWMLPHRLLYRDVPCRFCYKSVCPMGHHNCLRMVPPEAVVEAALDLLDEVRAQRTT